MTDTSKILEDLKTKRDELALQIHLGSKEAKDEWVKLEGKWNEFSKNAQLDKTSSGLGDALSALGHELKEGYERLRKAL